MVKIDDIYIKELLLVRLIGFIQPRYELRLGDVVLAKFRWKGITKFVIKAEDKGWIFIPEGLLGQRVRIRMIGSNYDNAIVYLDKSSRKNHLIQFPDGRKFFWKVAREQVKWWKFRSLKDYFKYQIVNEDGKPTFYFHEPLDNLKSVLRINVETTTALIPEFLLFVSLGCYFVVRKRGFWIWG